MKTKTILKTKVHGFGNHFVSDFCQDRHPFLEDKNEEMKKLTGIRRPVFFKAFQNLSEVLLSCSSSSEDKLEALLCLNEMTSHQEQKVEMIEFGFVEISANFLNSSDENLLYEDLRLLGSLVSIKFGRKRLVTENV